MIEHSLKIFRGLAVKRYKESDPPRKLFGALDKTDYIAPDDDKWCHNDNQSDNEEPELKKKMEETFGQKDSDSSDSDGDGDDEDGDGGDTGVVGASGAEASTAGTSGDTSAGGDEEDTESDDNPPDPGYEVYFDERGVKRIRRIRREDDDTGYIPSDTEAERLKKKQTVVRRNKKAKKNIGSSSIQQSIPQQEPT
ncbi:hypothetical protein Hanom_Chr03g00194531 [Helianthus anomalus]